jgi:hypothetical protein
MSAETAEKLTFQSHPLKDEIVKRWEQGWNNKQIHLWLNKEYPTVLLSISTLCKHHKRYKFNLRTRKTVDQEQKAKRRRKKRTLPLEDILWETIEQCRRMKDESTISAKDWQYLDQQMQAAIEKLLRIQQESGDTRDIAVVLTEIFDKIGAGDPVELEDITQRQISESEKREIALGVDSEDSSEQGVSS